MKRGASKVKGNKFERKVCKALSEWWSDGQHNDLCWRSAGSGSRGTTQKSKVAGFYGDVVAVSPLIDPLFNYFTVECKFYKELDITQPLRPGRFAKLGNIKLYKFWEQALGSAMGCEREPLLIFKTNYMPELIVCDYKLASLFQQSAMCQKPLPYMSLEEKLTIYNFYELLSVLDIAKVKEYLSSSPKLSYTPEFLIKGRTWN